MSGDSDASASTLCSGACASRHHTRTCAASTRIEPPVVSAKSASSGVCGPTTATELAWHAARAWIAASLPAWLLLLCVAILAAMLTPCAPGVDWFSAVLCACITTFALEVMVVMPQLARLYTPAWTLFWARVWQPVPATALRCISRNSWLSRPALGLLSLTRPWIALLMPTPPPDPSCPKTRSRSLARTSVSSCEGL